MLLYCIFLRIEKHNHYIDEWGRWAGQLLKSVERANRPNCYTLASDIPQEGSLQERVSLAWNSLSAESPGRWPHPAMPLCSLEPGGTDPETTSSWVQKDPKDHLSTSGMPTPLGTHPTVRLAGTWFSCCSQQIPQRLH